MSRTCLLVLVGLVCCASTAALGQQIIYVDDDAPLGGDGTTWTTAHRYLQDALWTAGPGDEIRIAGGTYTPDQDETELVTAGERGAAFELFSDLALYGGYAGLANPGNPDERNIVTYETRLSGDLADDDGLDFANNGENSYNVVIALATDYSAVLDGLVIRAGNANGACCMHDRGGGVYVEEGHLTIVDCNFRDNDATQGGGMCVNAGGVALTRCNFEDNRAALYAGGVYNYNAVSEITDCGFFRNVCMPAIGGGLTNFNSEVTLTGCEFSENAAGNGAGLNNYGNSQATLIDCTFTANTATSSGGGMYNSSSTGVTLTRCEFTGNQTDSFGGGLYDTYGGATLTGCTFTDNSAGSHGGAIYKSRGSSSTLRRCTLTGNTCDGEGGGLYVSGTTVLVGACTISGNETERYGGGLRGYDADVTVRNSLVCGNFAGYYGGGIYTSDCVTNVSGSTVVDNEADTQDGYGGGLYTGYNDAAPAVTDCIFWGNRDSQGGWEYSQIEGQTPIIDHSCVEHWSGSWGGAGNTGDGPQFVDRTGPDGDPDTWIDNDYHLTGTSPCVDAGDPAGDHTGQIDIDGQARVWDGDGDEVAISDMGADELGSFGLGDLDCDGDVDLFDVDPFTTALITPGDYESLYPGCSLVLADIDGDGEVSLFDIDPFVALLTSD